MQNAALSDGEKNIFLLLKLGIFIEDKIKRSCTFLLKKC